MFELNNEKLEGNTEKNKRGACSAIFKPTFFGVYFCAVIYPYKDEGIRRPLSD